MSVVYQGRSVYNKHPFVCVHIHTWHTYIQHVQPPCQDAEECYGVANNPFNDKNIKIIQPLYLAVYIIKIIIIKNNTILIYI